MENKKVYKIVVNREYRTGELSHTIDEVYVVKETPKQYQVNKYGGNEKYNVKLSKSMMENGKITTPTRYSKEYYSFSKENLINYFSDFYQNRINELKEELLTAQQDKCAYDQFVDEVDEN